MSVARRYPAELPATALAKVAGAAAVLATGCLHQVAWGETATSQASTESATRDEQRNNWPSFRGFGGNGRVQGATPPRTWSDQQSKNTLWKTPIAKHGMSSPVVWGKRVFLTGADEQSRDLYCFDAESGNLLWRHEVSDLPDSPADGSLPFVLQETGFAAPTAATNGRLIAAIFATGELVGVNFEGERVWAKHLGIPDNHYGHASSLICDEDLLFVQYDQQEDSRLLAFEMSTGKPVWQATRDQMSWSSPILVENQGRAELILTDNKSVCSYDPKTGERYWRIECLDGEVAPSAAYADGVVFVAVENSAASAVDVARQGEQPTLLWQWDESLPDSASLLATEEVVIIPTAFGVVTCLDSKTGEVLWEHEFDDGFCSSPVLVNDLAYMIDLSGSMYAFSAGRKFELFGRFDVGEPTYATPAFVGDRIYVRSLYHLFCIADQAD